MGILIWALIAIIFIAIWMYLKSRSNKIGNYGSNYTYYDILTDELDAKLGNNSSSLIQTYIDPENCPLYGNLPTLSQLVSMKQNNPKEYVKMLRDGTVKRAVNVKALKTWIMLGSSKRDKFQHFMNQVNQLNVDKVDMSNLENALKIQLSKAHY